MTLYATFIIQRMKALTLEWEHVTLSTKTSQYGESVQTVIQNVCLNKPNDIV